MEGMGFELAKWVLEKYGRVGSVVVSFVIIVIIAVFFIVMNLLPEPEETILWSACSSCRYKRQKSNTFVLTCPRHEKPPFLHIKSPPCPWKDMYKGCRIVENQSDPVVFKLEDLPKSIGKKY